MPKKKKKTAHSFENETPILIKQAINLQYNKPIPKPGGKAGLSIGVRCLIDVRSIPFTGQRQHSRSTSGVSQALQTHDVKSRTFLAP